MSAVLSPLRLLLLSLLVPLIFAGCGSGSLQEKLHPGALYSVTAASVDADQIAAADEPQSYRHIDKNYPYGVLKILHVTHRGVIFKLYADRYQTRPTAIEPQRLTYIPPGSGIIGGAILNRDGSVDRMMGMSELGYWPNKDFKPLLERMAFLADSPLNEEDARHRDYILSRLSPQQKEGGELAPSTSTPSAPATPVKTDSPAAHRSGFSPWTASTLTPGNVFSFPSSKEHLFKPGNGYRVLKVAFRSDTDVTLAVFHQWFSSPPQAQDLTLLSRFGTLPGGETWFRVGPGQLGSLLQDLSEIMKIDASHERAPEQIHVYRNPDSQTDFRQQWTQQETREGRTY